MTDQLVFSNVNNTAATTLKGNNQEVSETQKSKKSLWSRFVASFWDYTEKTGKSDTSSFDGIL